ncbi:MAG: carbohydrate kinase family protein [Eubacterium sp.]|jgi:sugar/nucleoside kinase (ribokinase family)|nr:carbohydrate kinase family protein [Eubacterium sp.]
MRYDVVGLGACLVDYLASVPKIIGSEEKVNVGGLKRFCGGPTMNNIVQAARLGLKCAWLGKIGDDENGSIIQDKFKIEGLDNEHVKVIPGAESSFTWLVVDSKGNRCIYMFPNITRTITSQEVEDYFSEAIASSRALHSEICQIPLSAVLRGVQIAKKAGTMVIIDMDVDTDILINESKLGTLCELDEIIHGCDVLKAGAEIARNYCGVESNQKAAEKLLSMGPRMVALTMGPHGCAMSNKENYLELPTPYVEVVDTTGAGDAFMGGMSYGVLSDWPIEKIGKFANACGAMCCSGFGPMESGNMSQLINLFGKDELGLS